MFGPIVKKYAWHLSAVVLCAAFLAGCQLGSGHSGIASIITPEELNAAQLQAAKLNHPLILLVTDPGNGAADNDAHGTFASALATQAAHKTVVTAWLDLSISRARATAARFHPLETPLLVCLSPRGVIISRDAAPITEDIILKSIQEALARSPELDAKLDQLEKAADNETDTDAQTQLADFLLDRKNAFEAIPVLAAIAHLDAVDGGLRIRAWAELVRAHFWIGETEKARHEAEDMMATLGPATPEARAAGNFVLGNQDATNPKHFARARKEFEAAIAAAPDSNFGKQAAAALANLPKGDSAK